jgi:hypothetical protein
MADSAFWRALATEFRELPPECHVLRADRHYVVGSGKLGQWNITASTVTGRVRFEAVARRAGAEIADPSTRDDLLTVWLETLMAQSESGFRFGPLAIEQNPDGSPGAQHMMGSIANVLEASANYCTILESNAVQAEFEEKQRNHPKNWSDFHQMIEAAEGFKELANAPVKSISEEFARNTLAQIHGIKPEEVTQELINFEIARLLPFYPSIELIPNAPTQASPVAEEKHVYVGIEAAREREKPEPVQPSVRSETIAAQLQRLREECRWTIPELAEAADLSSRQVSRHLSGTFQPLPRNISAYERAFSKHLKRKVVINKMS